ncbi:hypothetical protein [Bacillus sp. FJAT-45350]|uniref:hypothetical protein n=1 Tax=Bacillus sp. FJAT-45350 TaxID=2011014 RepID=UPI0011550E75|nr:hypothetical protein [Bacillus sp. FJAT-45350]
MKNKKCFTLIRGTEPFNHFQQSGSFNETKGVVASLRQLLFSVREQFVLIKNSTFLPINRLIMLR